MSVCYSCPSNLRDAICDYSAPFLQHEKAICISPHFLAKGDEAIQNGVMKRNHSFQVKLANSHSHWATYSNVYPIESNAEDGKDVCIRMYVHAGTCSTVKTWKIILITEYGKTHNMNILTTDTDLSFWKLFINTQSNTLQLQLQIYWLSRFANL